MSDLNPTPSFLELNAEALKLFGATAKTPADTAAPEAAKTGAKPDVEKETAKPDPDPIVTLVQRLQRASALLPEDYRGLATALKSLAQQSEEPGAIDRPMFRTQVAYTLQDMEKLVGPGTTRMPAELRSEMTTLAATAPGLQNPQMEALVRQTPQIEDRGLVRDVRRAAAIIAGLESDQNAPAVKENVDVLESRVRQAIRPGPQADPYVAPTGANEPETARAAQRPDPAQRMGTQAEATEPQARADGIQPQPQAQAGQGPAQAEATRTRAQASPGDGRDHPPERTAAGEKASSKVAESSTPQQQPQKNALGRLVDAISTPPSTTPLPWNPTPIAMGERISAFQRVLDQGETERRTIASEKSGVDFMKAIETFSGGPGAQILGKIDAAGSTEPGGVNAVMTEMKPGGRYANLRSEFDDALQKDRVFATAYTQVEQKGAQYGKDRLALATDYQEKKLDASQLDARFQRADEAIGEATSKIPGRTPGKSAMDELGEKVVQLLSKAVERVRAFFGREAVPEPLRSMSPSMSP